VTTHSAIGLGVYAVFHYLPPDAGLGPFAVSEDDAFETPTAPGISMSHLVTVSIRGTITHIINETGPTATAGSMYGYSAN
jgi:hypothetical protein